MKLKILLNKYEHYKGEYGYTVLLNDYVSIGLLPIKTDDNGYDMELRDIDLLNTNIEHLTIMIFNYDNCREYSFINPSFKEVYQYLSIWEQMFKEEK